MEPSVERVVDASAIDDATIVSITSLLHRAYAPLAARGMHYEARAIGATHLACDTSEHASELIAMYARRGFEIVGTTKWNEVNYRSVILSKRLPKQGLSTKGDEV